MTSEIQLEISLLEQIRARSYEKPSLKSDFVLQLRRDIRFLLNWVDDQTLEIARHHKDFAQWEDMADKGAQQIDRMQTLANDLDAAVKERDHWKSNHDAVVERNRVLRDRPDLPADRLPALKALQTQIAILTNERDVARNAVGNCLLEIPATELTDDMLVNVGLDEHTAKYIWLDGSIVARHPDATWIVKYKAPEEIDESDLETTVHHYGLKDQLSLARSAAKIHELQSKQYEGLVNQLTEENAELAKAIKAAETKADRHLDLWRGSQTKAHDVMTIRQDAVRKLIQISDSLKSVKQSSIHATQIEEVIRLLTIDPERGIGGFIPKNKTCEHGTLIAHSQLSVVWNGGVSTCTCCSSVYGYLDAGGWSFKGSFGYSMDKTLCIPCGGKVTQRVLPITDDIRNGR